MKVWQLIDLLSKYPRGSEIKIGTKDRHEINREEIGSIHHDLKDDVVSISTINDTIVIYQDI